MNNIEIKGNTTQKEDVDPEKPKEIKNEVILSVIDNDGKQKQIPIDIAFNGLKEGEYFFKENDKWYLHKLEYRTERIKMMNNIEILEEFIKHYKEVQEKYKDDEIQAEIERSCYFEEVPAEAIENLIKENKELKEKIEEYGKQLDLDFVEENFIPKSALQELLDIDEIDVVHCRLKRLLGDDN